MATINDNIIEIPEGAILTPVVYKGGYYSGLIDWSLSWSNSEQQDTPLSEVFCDFEDIHIDGNKHDRYSLRYNTEISSFQYTVVESKTDTLGSKYPFIRRNGNTYYRQFPLSGLITHFNENDYPEEYLAENIKKGASNGDGGIIQDSFSDKIKKYVANDENQLKQKFDSDYYQRSNLNGYTDYLLEREYRKNAIDYLYENRIRLFRSPTEGNLLVKLMNVTLSPNGQLDRRIYSLQATAYEIDDFTIENCVKYGIWDKNEEIIDKSTNKAQIVYKVGQLQHNDPAILTDNYFIKTNFYEEIRKEVSASVSGFAGLDSIVWMKAEFYNNPSFFGQENGKIGLLVSDTSELYDILLKQFPNLSVTDNGRIYFRNQRQYNNLSFFYNNNSNFFDTVIAAGTGLFQELAYTIGIRVWGNKYDWDNFYNWSEETKEALMQDVKDTFRVMNPLSSTATEEVKKLYDFLGDSEAYIVNKTIGAIIEDIKNITSIFFSNAALLILRYSVNLDKDDLLLQHIEDMRVTNFDSVCALNILRISVADFNSIFDGHSKYFVEKNGGISEEVLDFLQLLIFIAFCCAVRDQQGFGIKKDTSPTSEDGDNDRGIMLVNYTEDDENYFSTTSSIPIAAGYQMVVNGKDILVAPHGHYELIDSDTSINELCHYRLGDEQLQCHIDYIAKCYTLPPVDGAYTRQFSYQYYKVGQIRGAENNEDVIQRIRDKYTTNINQQNGQRIKRTVIEIPYLSIEGEPYLCFNMEDSSGQKEIKVLNNSGIVTFNDSNTTVTKLLFYKYHGMIIIDSEHPEQSILGDNILETIGENQVIQDRGEIIYSDQDALNDVLINYICLIRETRYS